MLNKAQKLMNQREMMIEEAKQVLATLRATEEEMMYQAPKTNITINKGRIIEVPVTKEIIIDNTNEEEIKELKDELFSKELLLNEFREAVDKNIKDMQMMNEEILDLKDELEIKNALIENLRAQLRAAQQNQRTIYVEDEIPEETNDESVKADNEPETNKGGDAMPSFINIPDEFKNNQRIKELLKYYTDELNKITEDKRVFGKTITVEQQKRMLTNKANEELEKAMSQCAQSDSHKLTVDEIVRANGVTALFGKITLGGKEYAFKYDATFELPVVYGCMNMDLIHEAKAVLDGLGRLDRDESNLGQKHVNAVKYDFANNIVVWISDDGCFKGYTDKYAFVWDPSHAQPCGITVINALSNFKRYRKMNASWGNGFVARAEFIMNYCRQMVTNTTNDKEPEYTNEVEVDFSTPQNTNDEVVSEWDDIDM